VKIALEKCALEEVLLDYNLPVLSISDYRADKKLGKTLV
jgi:hypothetical protein